MAKLPPEPGVCRRGVLCALWALAVLTGSAAVGQYPGPALIPPGPAMVPPGPPGASPPPPPAAVGEQPMLGQDPGAVPPRPAEEMVVEVRIEGNRAIPLEKILPNIRTRAGRPFDLQTIEEDVRKLNKTRLFVTVKPLSKPVPGGRLVIFQIIERPTFQEVKIIGNDIMRTKPLKKELELKVGDAADPFAVEEGRRRVEEFYHKHGYSKVRVTVLEGNKPGDLRAFYLINEGPKQRVFWVNFVGNKIVSAARLRAAVIKSGPPILYLFKGEVDRKQIDEDVERLIAYYRGLGFFQAAVGRELEFNEKQNWLTLTFVVDEGPRSKIRNVSIVGNTKFSNEQLSEKLKLVSGQYFNQSTMIADTNSIQEKYGGVGYVFTDIKPETRFLEQPGEVDLAYTITEGDRCRVGRINIEIKGENPHTKLTTVLNRLSLKPGDIVDVRELRASERRLKASGLFLVDPTRGAMPKIVFTPPDQEKDDEVADRPERRTSFYWPIGSSPYESQQSPPLPPPPPGERYVDVVVHASDNEADVQAPPSINGSRPAGGTYSPAPPPNGRVEPMQGPMVIRGQYSGEGGYSTPDVAPRYPSSPPRPTGNYPAPATASSVPAYPAPNQPATGYPATQPYQNPQYQNPPANQYVPRWTPAPGYQANPAYQQPMANRQAPPYAADGTRSVPATRPPVYQPAAQPNWGNAPVPTPPAAQPPAMPSAGANPGAPVAQPWPGVPPQPEFVPAPDPRFGAPAAGPPCPPPGAVPPFGQPPLPITEHLFGEKAPLFNPTPNGEPLQDLPFIIRADETQTGRLMFGVGVNSDAGVVGSIVLDEQNFDWTRVPRSWDDIRNGTAWRGAGQRFRIEAVPGNQVQRYMINFQEPYLLDSPVSLGLSGFYFDRIYNEWRENRLGGRVSLGYQLTHDLTGSIAFRAMNVNISDPITPTPPDLERVLGNNGLYGVGITLAHDTRDNAFLATEGHLIELSFEQVFGSFRFPHTEVEISQYFKLYERPDGSGRHVLSLSGRAGISGDNTPIFERYFAGGFSTIRGFRFRGVSPRVNNVAVGGNFELLATAQYLFPITADDMLRGVVFCDSGTIEPTIKDWNQSYRVAPGFGLRIVIPAMGPAPIALDFAFPVLRESGDRNEVFSFFVGFNR